ncbi:aldo/keto reductase [Actinocatenispora comari]|uniref:Oxidoreductase n=1 Tax=Actinocatenispora comari TaxID=2807577 RepID=A0A8J4ACP4_9ACTN|nr:aldo/keto reductase [Actinocatenispora comari]GIL28876.1 oxidoreductase [Actinocatenispora comari]
MQTRTLGSLDQRSSVLVYGAAALSDVDQDTADASIAEALDAGINHFDVAASYGDAELRLGPAMPAIRDRIFLATKTGERSAEGAYRQINESLERLRTDHVDLLQLHAVGDLAELDRVCAPDGALAGAVRARDEGLVGAVGITGHGHQAPATHLEALRRYDFATVLTPLNYTLGQRADYYRDWQALATETQRRGVGLLTIKSGARRNWPDGADQRYTTWYEPLDEQAYITASVSWVLSHPEITGIPTPSDVRLLRYFVAAERSLQSRAEAEQVLATVPDYSSPFLRQVI